MRVIPKEKNQTLNKDGTPRKPRKDAFWNIPDKIEKLKASFQNSLSIKEACKYAEVQYSEYQRYKNKYPIQVATWEDEKLTLLAAAKMNIAKSIIEEHDISNSWRLLERMDRDYLPRSQQQFADSDGENIKLQSVIVPIKMEKPKYDSTDAGDSPPASAKTA